MSEFKVRLGDMFYVPYPKDTGIVFAAEHGFMSLDKAIDISLKECTDLGKMYVGVIYLGNILDAVIKPNLDLLVDNDSGLTSAVWKGTLDNYH